ncbi:ParA family protein [Mycoplasma sp. 2634B]|uniref:ParA family protein n=1 Tax=Mycoplasma sp. 2634B TaxID=3401692 RepID=UPI003AB0DD5D
MQTKVLTYLNNKGGVLKTTLATNHAVYLAQQGYKVLIIDTDAQNNVAETFYLPKAKYSIWDIMFNDISYQQTIISKNTIDFITSSIELAQFDETLLSLMEQKKKFKLPNEIIDEIILSKKYDYIIIDTSPNLSNLLYYTLLGSQYLIIPFNPDFSSISGLTNVINFINNAKKENHKLEILSLVPTITNARSEIEEDLIFQLKDHFKLLPISQHRIKNSQSPRRYVLMYNQPILGYKKYASYKSVLTNYFKSLKIK